MVVVELDETRSQVVEDFTGLRELVSEIEYYIFYHYCLYRHQGQDHDQALASLEEQYHNLEGHQIRGVVDGIMARIHSANQFLLDYLAGSNYDVTFVPLRRAGGVRRRGAVGRPGPLGVVDPGGEVRPRGGWSRSGWVFVVVIAALLIAIFLTSRPN